MLVILHGSPVKGDFLFVEGILFEKQVFFDDEYSGNLF